MSKRTFIWFGILVVVLAVAIPWLVFHNRGDAAQGQDKVAANLTTGQELFEINCGTCHTLYAAGTDGNYAPDLDELLAPNGPPSGPTEESTIKSTELRVLNAVENGVNTSTTRSPPSGRNTRRSTRTTSRARPPERLVLGWWWDLLSGWWVVGGVG